MKYLLISFFISVKLLAQQKTPNDFTVIIHEETINKILKTIDSINGTKDYEVMFIKGKYHYTAKNFKMKIRPDSSQFTCDVKVDVGPFTYRTSVPGHVKISYDKITNQIQIKVVRATFELYTNVLGKKIHIKDIDLADNFKEPFSFEGPKSMTTDFDYTMPDGKIKKIYMQPTECELNIRWQEIIANFELEACDVPFITLKK
ncbi:MAG TPA: hypothetical protein VNZ49_05465 [Bacteroidia bacterium]|jgi:hypothetical protein|nr:hypothetical protein [Bacteroidia bacterium]